MAKRTAALVAALVLWPSMAAGASPEPLWPCVVPVWVEDGARLPRYALGALRQLDEATVISWPLVDDPADAMVVVDWADLDGGKAGLATTWASDVENVRSEVLIDPSVPSREAYRTFLHEFGHIAGLDHNSERSVMGGGDIPFRRFTAWDLDALSEVGCHAGDVR